jgi:hypothetical protein
MKMPKFLFKSSDEFNGTYQNEEGLLQWSGRYRLIGEKYRKKSSHLFMVPSNSVFRLFFDTLNSGVKVKYTLLGDKKQVILTTDHEQPFHENDLVIKLLD